MRLVTAAALAALGCVGGGTAAARPQKSKDAATFINLICHDRPYGALCGSSNGGYCDIDWTGDVEVGKCQVWSEPHVGSYSWMITECSATNATRVTWPDSTDCTGKHESTYTPTDSPLGMCKEAGDKSSCASSGGTSCMSVCTPRACTAAAEAVCDKGNGCVKCTQQHAADLKRTAGCTDADLKGFCYSPSPPSASPQYSAVA